MTGGLGGTPDILTGIGDERVFFKGDLTETLAFLAFCPITVPISTTLAAFRDFFNFLLFSVSLVGAAISLASSSTVEEEFFLKKRWHCTRR